MQRMTVLVRAIRAELTSGPIIAGSLRQVYRKCGKATCRTCRRSRGHGPYWQYYGCENGRVRGYHVRTEELGALRDAIARNQLIEKELAALKMLWRARIWNEKKWR